MVNVKNNKSAFFGLHLWEFVVLSVYNFESKKIKTNMTMVMKDITNNRTSKKSATYSYIMKISTDCEKKGLFKKVKVGRNCFISLTSKGLECAKAIVVKNNIINDGVLK